MTSTFTVYALFLLICLWAVARRSKTIVNPVSYYAIFFGLQTLVAPILLIRLGLTNMHDFSESDLRSTVGLSALYFGCIALAFMLRSSPLAPLLRRLLPNRPLQITKGIRVIARLQAAGLFAVLMYASSAGTLWFSNPRLAYQSCRDGAGVWWALCQGSLVVLFGCVLYGGRRRSTAGVWLTAIAFGFLAYFLGSKGFVLAYLVLGAFYIQHRVQGISKRALITAGTMAILGIISLQLVQGTASTVLDTLEYFDYFNNTSMFVSDFDHSFGYQHGGVLFSELWLYVPRALYPAKPYLYGVTQIMAVYHPGAAENGSTPGMLPWAGPYLDFGAIGVIADGVLTGFVAKAAFDLFRSSHSLWTFLLFAQVGLLCGPLAFYSAPFPLFLVWIGIEWALFSLNAGFVKLIRFASIREGNTAGSALVGMNQPGIDAIL